MTRFYFGILSAFFLTLQASANPYPNPNAIPKDTSYLWSRSGGSVRVSRAYLNKDAKEIIRIQIDWNPSDETYTVDSVRRENSGTQALLARALHEDPLGSYRAVLRDPTTGNAVYFDALGTGREFRKLVRAMTFRFPVPSSPMTFEMSAENPQSGKSEKVVLFTIDPAQIPSQPPTFQPEVRVLKPATQSPALIMNVYADGYTADRQGIFWEDSKKVSDAFVSNHFPNLGSIEIRGVFAPSMETLGGPRQLGNPIPDRNSFLGLFYPYWENFGRWYNVVYPTREKHFRDAIGSVPYDYPIALIDDSNYWGIGNYKELTAIPAHYGAIAYLLLHEFGHFMGVNEEYEGGGRTELEFAPGTVEPWSQNITFLPVSDYEHLKWKDFVSPSTPVPTPEQFWNGSAYGAYSGGYGDSDSVHSHKPGFSCVMERGSNYCPICSHAIEAVIQHDLGL